MSIRTNRIVSFAFVLVVVTLGLGCGEPDVPVDVGVHDAGAVDVVEADAVEADAVGGECAPVVVRSLGEFAVGEGGLTEPITFEVPACTTSFLLQARGGVQNEVLIYRVLDPRGELVVSDVVRGAEVPVPHPAQWSGPVRTASRYGAAAALVPNSPGVEVMEGSYSVVVQAVHPEAGVVNPVSVDLVLKNHDTMMDGGQVDLVFHLTGSEGYTAASFEAEVGPSWVAMVDSVLAAANIGVGSVRYRDISSDYQQVSVGLDFSVEDSITDEELNAMFGESTDNAINVFVVQHLRLFGTVAISGQSGGIPGSWGVPGSPQSGVAIATRAGEDDRLADYASSRVIAHEVAHYLGLFHAAEPLDASIVDPLPDTPETPDGVAENLMNSVQPGALISPQQVRVLHNHPAVY